MGLGTNLGFISTLNLETPISGSLIIRIDRDHRSNRLLLVVLADSLGPQLKVR